MHLKTTSPMRDRSLPHRILLKWAEESQSGQEEETPLFETAKQRELMSMLLYVAAKAKARQNARRKT